MNEQEPLVRAAEKGYIGKGYPGEVNDYYESASIRTRERALKRAAYKGHIGVVKYLVEKGVDIHADFDDTLEHAARGGNFEVVKYLVEKGADIHALEDKALMGAITGIPTRERELKSTTEEEKLKRAAAYKRHIDVVKYLVENGANVRAQKDQAIRLAATKGHIEIVKSLVDAGADVHIYEEDPLIRAARYGFADIVQYLVENGANFHVDEDALLISHAANKETAKYLISLYKTSDLEKLNEKDDKIKSDKDDKIKGVIESRIPKRSIKGEIKSPVTKRLIENRIRTDRFNLQLLLHGDPKLNNDVTWQIGKHLGGGKRRRSSRRKLKKKSSHRKNTRRYRRRSRR